jgi:hypothetical protein
VSAGADPRLVLAGDLPAGPLAGTTVTLWRTPHGRVRHWSRDCAGGDRAVQAGTVNLGDGPLLKDLAWPDGCTCSCDKSGLDYFQQAVQVAEIRRLAAGSDTWFPDNPERLTYRPVPHPAAATVAAAFRVAVPDLADVHPLLHDVLTDSSQRLDRHCSDLLDELWRFPDDDMGRGLGYPYNTATVLRQNLLRACAADVVLESRLGRSGRKRHAGNLYARFTQAGADAAFEVAAARGSGHVRFRELLTSTAEDSLAGERLSDWANADSTMSETVPSDVHDFFNTWFRGGFALYPGSERLWNDGTDPGVVAAQYQAVDVAWKGFLDGVAACGDYHAVVQPDHTYRDHGLAGLVFGGCAIDDEASGPERVGRGAVRGLLPGAGSAVVIVVPQVVMLALHLEPVAGPFDARQPIRFTGSCRRMAEEAHRCGVGPDGVLTARAKAAIAAAANRW